MMKYVFVLATLLIFSVKAQCQAANITAARAYLSDGNYAAAMPLVDAAVRNEETKGSAEAWFLRGMAYLMQATDKVSPLPSANAVSSSSMMTALVLNPDYGPEINNGLYSNALLSFNDGVAAYSSAPAAAYKDFMKVKAIYEAGNGKRFIDNKDFSTLLTSATSNAAYSAVAAGKDDDALPLFSELRAQGIKDTAMYQSIIEIYQRAKRNPEALATIKEARDAFPNSVLFRNMEINFYMNTGQSSALIPQLEEAVKIDPDNPELLFNLASEYENAAFPKNAPAEVTTPEFSALLIKAEDAFRKAVMLKPNDPQYNYNFGVLYYQYAGGLIAESNTIGTTPAEQQQYDNIVSLYNEQLNKAMPFFEKAYAVLEPRAASLNAEDKITYRQTLTGLKEVYNRTGKKNKGAEIQSKIDGLN